MTLSSVGVTFEGFAAQRDGSTPDVVTRIHGVMLQKSVTLGAEHHNI